MCIVKELHKLKKSWAVVVLIAIAGCNSKTVTCYEQQYVSTTITNTTSAPLDVTFCSVDEKLSVETQTVPSLANKEPFFVTIGEIPVETEIPYADSAGDGCAKMGAASEKVGDMVPLLNGSDLLTTKTCYDGKSYSFIEITETCPDGFNNFDQNSIQCL